MRNHERTFFGLVLGIVLVGAGVSTAQESLPPARGSVLTAPATAGPVPFGEPTGCLRDAPQPRGLLQRSSPACDGAPEYWTPPMLGDFIGPVANLFSDVKIAEGESPRPTDRVYYNFHYFNNLNKPRWVNPVEPIHNVDLYRHVFGAEKTFFNDTISLGLRVPFYTLDAEAKDFRLLPLPGGADPLVVPGGPGFDTTHFGNIAAVIKALLWEDRQTGSLISGGAVISFPTASSVKINPGPSLLAYAQPFGGFILIRGDFFVQGFSSVALPVGRSESIVLFNDIGVGYLAYRNASGSALTRIVPTVELHMANPLRQPDAELNLFGITDSLRLHNVVNLTLGTYFEFWHQASLGVGLVVPTTGPKPFDIEAVAQLDWRF